uniref:C2H2-type domain-containing protein n=1 Tax=Rhabditophanes sp. KR3021 TaxID=114890 RepID=A0AC35TIU7_9BILA
MDSFENNTMRNAPELKPEALNEEFEKLSVASHSSDSSESVQITHSGDKVGHTFIHPEPKKIKYCDDCDKKNDDESSPHDKPCFDECIEEKDPFQNQLEEGRHGRGCPHHRSHPQMIFIKGFIMTPHCPRRRHGGDKRPDWSPHHHHGGDRGPECTPHHEGDRRPDWSPHHHGGDRRPDWSPHHHHGGDRKPDWSPHHHHGGDRRPDWSPHHHHGGDRRPECTPHHEGDRRPEWSPHHGGDRRPDRSPHREGERRPDWCPRRGDRHGEERGTGWCPRRRGRPDEMPDDMRPKGLFDQPGKTDESFAPEKGFHCSAPDGLVQQQPTQTQNAMNCFGFPQPVPIAENSYPRVVVSSLCDDGIERVTVHIDENTRLYFENGLPKSPPFIKEEVNKTSAEKTKHDKRDGSRKHRKHHHKHSPETNFDYGPAFEQQPIGYSFGKQGTHLGNPLDRRPERYPRFNGQTFGYGPFGVHRPEMFTINPPHRHQYPEQYSDFGYPGYQQKHNFY